MTGIVSNIIVSKKYGFITGDNGQEYFFHAADVPFDWLDLCTLFSRIGGGKTKVEFEAAKTPKGPRAKNVALLKVT